MIAESVQMKIKPFKAYRYDPKVVEDVGKCIAPPYDVIDASLRERLYEQSPYNIVRVIQGKTGSGDNDTDNVYTRAADHFNTWIQGGALKQDEKDMLYGYVQDFEVAGAALQRQSFISLVELEPFGGAIKPHEKILKKPMEDRLKLKRATAARFGLVFMLYDDPDTLAERAIQRAGDRDALLDFTDEQGVRHRLYAIEDGADQEAIMAMMGQRTCVIADGHHRYTTGLTLREECDLPTARFQMVAFANTRQQGVIVLATHRLVHGLDALTETALLERLRGDFALETFPFADETQKELAKQSMLQALHQGLSEDRCAFGIYCGRGTFHLATLNDRSRMTDVAAEMSEAWQGLDVAVLHKLILEGQLGIDEEKLSSGRFITYVKDTPTAIDDSIAQVDRGQQQAAFFTNPIKMEQLFAVTDTGERMPQKSTYFYPKMYTGLTIQKL